ncbi:MAG: glycosyl hydrolase [Ignavibacteriales bacterium]|nr:glycosyl hydrolase [Ignavibacteriales bacterium]
MSLSHIRNFFIINFSLATFLFAQIPIPATGCYHAAFTGDNSQQQFETLAKKNIAIEMFFMGWPLNPSLPDFPITKCNEISSNGAVPHITWMCQVSGFPYPLDGIIEGNYDSYIRGYADQVRNWGKPLFIRLGHEMNGDWYTYGGAKNGSGTLNGFGDPGKADGPERFIAAYKRVHDLFKSEGVTNVAWIWCPNNGSAPNAAWNEPEEYYPGDDYVDWIGFDGYNFGKSQTWSNWVQFKDIYTALYNKFDSYKKPLMIGEFASVEGSGTADKAEWIKQAYYLNLRFNFPHIKAVTWFHVAKTEGTVWTDWRINSSDAALKAYQDYIADPYFLSTISATNVDEDNQLPTEFILKQNYPNPFNPSTNVQYSISEPSHVTLKIYDLLGREVMQLVNKYQDPGNYTVNFNASKLSTGIYIYTLSSGIHSKSKKLMLLK